LWVGPGTPDCPGAGWRPASDDLTRGAGYITSIVAASKLHKVIVVTSDSMVQMTDDIFPQNQQPVVWTDINDGNLPTGRVFSSVAVNPSDPNTLYLGVMGFGTGYGTGLGHVFKGVRTGSSFKWTNISGNLADVPVNSILVDSVAPDHIYVATDAGVWVTTDGGSNWDRYGEGLPHSAVVQLKMSTKVPRQLVAATHGRGAWVISPLE